MANDILQQWNQIQDDLRLKINPNDDLDFEVLSFPTQDGVVKTASFTGGCYGSAAGVWKGLRYIAGMDVSFFEGTDQAIGCVVVLEVPGMKTVYTDCEKVTLDVPYIPSYLAFREAPILLSLLARLKNLRPEIHPQLLLIDGNGILHPRMCGLACHVGVSADIPAIGVGKNFLQVEKLTLSGMKESSRANLTKGGTWMPITGASGKVYGAALRSTNDSVNPIFVSPGHRVSIGTAVEITAWCCKCRVPEPIRAADHASRDVVRAAGKAR
ncbi:hypothetical protein HKX48_003572 [Thoreauomyces humboldtii]|nr:hypothetical protein HKX48_003572 [Thoreauomyces humboldtii]